MTDAAALWPPASRPPAPAAVDRYMAAFTSGAIAVDFGAMERVHALLAHTGQFEVLHSVDWPPLTVGARVTLTGFQRMACMSEHAMIGADMQRITEPSTSAASAGSSSSSRLRAILRFRLARDLQKPAAMASDAPVDPLTPEHITALVANHTRLRHHTARMAQALAAVDAAAAGTASDSKADNAGANAVVGRPSFRAVGVVILRSLRAGYTLWAEQRLWSFWKFAPAPPARDLSVDEQMAWLTGVDDVYAPLKLLQAYVFAQSGEQYTVCGLQGQWDQRTRQYALCDVQFTDTLDRYSPVALLDAYRRQPRRVQVLPSPARAPPKPQQFRAWGWLVPLLAAAAVLLFTRRR